MVELLSITLTIFLCLSNLSSNTGFFLGAPGHSFGSGVEFSEWPSLDLVICRLKSPWDLLRSRALATATFQLDVVQREADLWVVTEIRNLIICFGVMVKLTASMAIVLHVRVIKRLTLNTRNPPVGRVDL